MTNEELLQQVKELTERVQQLEELVEKLREDLEHDYSIICDLKQMHNL